jgi:putative multicomponent Na+:H+ antiporter subunit B
MTDLYVILLVALLPLSACMLVFQVNPYHALVIRGILGAVAALVYALLGAADVALTEALVGTMLSITLYAVAVRSSMSMRVGILEEDLMALSPQPVVLLSVTPRLPALQKALHAHHLRLEWVPYPSLAAMQTGLLTKEVHTTCVLADPDARFGETAAQPYVHLETRVPRLYEILKAEFPASAGHLTLLPLSALLQVQSHEPQLRVPDPLEVQT